MSPSRSTVAAAAALAVAAATTVGASVMLASQEGAAEPVVEFMAPASEPSDRTRDRSERLDSSDNGGSDSTLAPTAPPDRLQVPSIGTDAHVRLTGVTANGDAEIPRSGDVVGWYRFGSQPGDPRGSAVLIGHRDTNAEGPGELFDLDEVRAGDRVLVISADRTLRYEVGSLQSITKAALPDALFRRSGPHRLVVITCGGPYLPEAGGYQDNLIAIARPLWSSGRKQ